ncbi:MAG: response regulator transcription factor [Bacteroidota bacterium]|nr:response regulator transcription factor [Bacteroidota bacterium]
MIQAIAIDDEPLALEVVKNHISKIPFLSLDALFNNPLHAIDYINHNKVDLIFLDMQMPDLSGIDFLNTMNRKEAYVVFTTAHSEYALESYEFNAVDYLLKPFDFSRFLKSVMKVKERMSASLPGATFFFVNSGYQQIKISFDDIYFIKGDGNYITYYTKKEKIIVRSSIKEALDFLPQKLCIRAHRSYIVFLNQIDKIDDNHILVGNARISIGANYKENLMKMIGL